MNTKTTTMIAMALCCGLPLSAGGGQALTSASAGATGYGTGTAVAPADYIGDGAGFARTKTDSGRVNLARGVSVGVDEGGVSLSASYALAGQVGPAVGGTFNVHVGRDGQTAVSGGRVISQGDSARRVSAGGAAGRVHYRSPYAVSAAGGRTGPRGQVAAETFSRRGGDPRRVYVRTAQRRVARYAGW